MKAAVVMGAGETPVYAEFTSPRRPQANPASR